MNTQMKTFNSNICRILLATCLSALCLTALSTQAATITVMNTNNSAAGSLRQALADAVDGDTINFDSSLNRQTITLTGGELLVDKNIIISGPGADMLAVDSNYSSRVFHIGSGKTVTISGLTITHGNGNFDIGAGGGIYNDHATLTVNNCTVSGNIACIGGGIFNGSQYGGSATLTVNNSIISGNSAWLEFISGGIGGGIGNWGEFDGSATVTINNSTLSGNSAEGESGEGGGIGTSGVLGNATVTINNSTISGNSAGNLGGSGGGIWNVSATLTINNSTLSGNSAPGEFGAGGAVTQGDGSLTITNSTLSGNSASRKGGAILNTGFSSSATLTVHNSTLSGNSATSGGGIYNDGYFNSTSAHISNTILKTGASGENIVNSGVVTSNGYNLSSDNAGGFLTATGDQVNADPLLGPLRDNGGPTFTHALLSGSPAIDAGDPSFTPPPNYDQRGTGFPRVFNGRVDIGAIEMQTVTPAYAGQIQPPINPDGTSTFNYRRGVVPVKFNLTLGGVATCELPPATIAVTRTAGGVIGSVNESVYTANADTGSNFRIDSCQYVYNLNSRALGVGTYRVDILINGQVVGSAVFALN
jgi:hypothetical protein